MITWYYGRLRNVPSPNIKLTFLYFTFTSVIPQTCRYKSKKYECGLSISCVLSGGKPMDLCSGGMIWSCCVDIISQQTQQQDEDDAPQSGSLNNASKYKIFCTF